MEYIKIEKDGLVLTVTSEPTTPPSSIIMGGDDSNPTWEVYLKDWFEEYRPHINLIKDAIEKLEWVGETGGSKANTTAFEFSDGICISFSWRAWGDLMQAIVNKQEGYLTYYM